MENLGWVKFHRKLKEASFYKRSIVVHLFVHLLLSANQQKRAFYWNGKEIQIEAGQLITGRDELSKQTGITPQSIRTALTILKSTSTITIKSTNRFSLISIPKWQEYQIHLTSKTTSRLTNNQPTTNQQLTTNNNDKNIKNDKNNNTLVEKIVLWAYKRARVNPSCTVDSFRKSLSSAIAKIGEAKIKKMYEMEDNAIRFLTNIKNI